MTRVAILGADTLLGREIEDVLGSRRVTHFSPLAKVALRSRKGKPYSCSRWMRTPCANIRFSCWQVLRKVRRKHTNWRSLFRRPTLIDCQGDLESHPEARISAPFFQPQPTTDWLLVPPQAAAQMIALALTRLAAVATVQRTIAHVFEPASERGKRGIGELQTQTTNLLSFKGLDKKVYDAQVAFNLLPKLGADAASPLAAVEHRIERHLATLLSRQSATIPMPSLRVIQAPVFHGYSISLWAEFNREMSDQSAAEALASAQIEVRTAGEEAADIIGAAGQSGLIAGDIRTDPNNPRSLWIWLVADNLRLIADSAAAIINRSNE